MLWFAETKCDIVVLEVGLGGTLDSTNVIGAYAPIGAGIPGHKLTNSIGVMKA